MNYVIIGNSAAGIGAVEGIRLLDRDGKITVISSEQEHVYSRPLISYYLSGQVELAKLKYRPDNFYQQNGVEALLGDRVLRVAPAEKGLELQSGQRVTYDKLLIATGGQPFIPPLKGQSGENIFSFTKLDDARSLLAQIKDLKEKKIEGQAVILGAGLIGLKAAEALIKAKLKVTVVELSERILSTILDEQAAALLQSHLEEHGVDFILGDTITDFSGNSTHLKVNLKSGGILDCNLAVIAVGVKPNIPTITDNLIISKQGLLINQQMETSVADIYAAGDVAEGYDMLKGLRRVIPLWPNAYNQGLVAGQNMAGGNASYEEGFARNAISFFGLPVITAGIIDPPAEDLAAKAGYEVLTTGCLEKKTYKKVVLRENRMVGFINLNAVDRAGILTGLIKEKRDVGGLKDQLLSNDFGYLSFAEEWRREKLWKG